MCIRKHIRFSAWLFTIPLILIVHILYGNHSGHPRHKDYDYYYAKLGNAFANGQTYLLDTPHPSILTLENPYIKKERRIKKARHFWDASLYQGKYYLYFGPVPALIPWLPVYIATGMSLSDRHIVQIYTIIGTCSLLLLLYFIARKLAPPTLPPRILYISWGTTALPICFGTMIIGLLKRPMVYEAAIAGSFAYIALGLLCLWLAYTKHHRNSIWWKIIGSICFGLAAGCRFIHVASVVILFMCWLSQYRGKTNHAWLKEGVLLITPWAIIIACILSYNYLRFGSLLETGISYQLTVMDMRDTTKVWSWDRYFSNHATRYLFDQIPAHYLLPWHEKFGTLHFKKPFGIIIHSSFILWAIVGLFMIKRAWLIHTPYILPLLGLYTYGIFLFLLLSSFFYFEARYMVDFVPWFMLLASVSYLYITLHAKQGWHQYSLMILGITTALWTAYSGFAPFSCLHC